MGNTTNFGFPYPSGSDDFDVASDVQALAESIDSKLKLIELKTSVVTAAQARSNPAFDVLGTADRVSDMTLLSGGLLLVIFNALWKNDVATLGTAAIFLDEVQAKAWNDNVGGDPIGQDADGPATTNRYTALGAAPGGLKCGVAPSADHNAPAATGQIISLGLSDTTRGLGCLIAADAGDYDVSIRYRTKSPPLASGTVTVKERRLWVASLATD